MRCHWVDEHLHGMLQAGSLAVARWLSRPDAGARRRSLKAVAPVQIRSGLLKK